MFLRDHFSELDVDAPISLMQNGTVMRSYDNLSDLRDDPRYHHLHVETIRCDNGATIITLTSSERGKSKPLVLYATYLAMLPEQKRKLCYEGLIRTAEKDCARAVSSPTLQIAFDCAEDGCFFAAHIMYDSAAWEWIGRCFDAAYTAYDMLQSMS